MNDEYFFETHTRNLKGKLDVDPEVVWGSDAAAKVKGYTTLTRGIYIWENNKNLVAVRDIKKIGILAHEMRHAWQYKNRKSNKFEFKQPPKARLLRMLGSLIYKHNYAFDSREYDANIFAIDYCNSVGLYGEAKHMRNEIRINYFTRCLVVVMDVMFLVLIYAIYNFVAIML